MCCWPTCNGAFNPEVLTEAVRRCYDNGLLTSGVDEYTQQLANESLDEEV